MIAPRASLEKLQQSELLRFCVVGGLGFCVDGGALLVLSETFGWSALAARLVGFPLAVTMTWLLNRIWTFRGGRDHAAARQYGAYLLIQLGGLAINFSAFALLVAHTRWFAVYPIIALALGAAMALAFTFACSRQFAFSGARL